MIVSPPRQSEALPLWESFINWEKQKHQDGVRHAGTTDALEYLIKHAQGLQTYCHDGRLPMSNIQSEHVAKTIAIARNYAKFRIMQSNVQQHRYFQ